MPEVPATEPSARARELVRGAYDLHVHVEPDLAKRRIDDLSLARRFGELGLAGFVLKSHYVPTAERAAVVRGAVPGVDALGAIVLNAGVGGLNAQAVEIAARGGARIVWLPTVDSENEASEDGPKPAKQPVWRKIQDEFTAAGVGERPRARDAGGARGRARSGRAPRPRARDRAPRARRDPHGGRCGAGGRSPAGRGHAPRLSDAGRARRRAAGARSQGRAARALLRADPLGQGLLGGDVRGHPRDGRRAATCSRPISARSRTRRSRTGSH